MKAPTIEDLATKLARITDDTHQEARRKVLTAFSALVQSTKKARRSAWEHGIKIEMPDDLR